MSKSKRDFLIIKISMFSGAFGIFYRQKKTGLLCYSLPLKEVAQYENVYCKISGMATEADWKNWKEKDFVPYLDTVVEAFGTDRILFGSDWPVCLLAGSYKEVLGIVKNYFSSFTAGEQEKFWGLNAEKFYTLI